MRTGPLNSNGQIVLPALAVMVICLLLSIEFVAWATRSLWKMRMEVAADAAALSAARAQAEVLNTLVVENLGLNALLQKVRMPFGVAEVGGIKLEKLGAYREWNVALQNTAGGFKTFPAGVGETVARLNGAEGYSPYFPFPMNHHLVPISVVVGTIMNTFPFLIDIDTYDHVYFARGWSHDYVKAQPPHRTAWLVSHGKTRAMASARLWLDVKPGDMLNNGGFPRVQDGWLRDAGIQGFYPQFNAQLINLSSGQNRTLLAKLLGAV